mmetsp:Transcript_90482/g.255420  ORF Transcript_90482/g.255420 Transcript_90482/m.255420 type:complete len:257 (-) Transcript_90482:1260-2030(-)
MRVISGLSRVFRIALARVAQQLLALPTFYHSLSLIRPSCPPAALRHCSEVVHEGLPRHGRHVPMVVAHEARLNGRQGNIVAVAKHREEAWEVEHVIAEGMPKLPSEPTVERACDTRRAVHAANFARHIELEPLVADLSGEHPFIPRLHHVREVRVHVVVHAQVHRPCSLDDLFGVQPPHRALPPAANRLADDVFLLGEDPTEGVATGQHGEDSESDYDQGHDAAVPCACGASAAHHYWDAPGSATRRQQRDGRERM